MKPSDSVVFASRIDCMLSVYDRCQNDEKSFYEFPLLKEGDEKREFRRFSCSAFCEDKHIPLKLNDIAKVFTLGFKKIELQNKWRCRLYHDNLYMRITSKCFQLFVLCIIIFNLLKDNIFTTAYKVSIRPPS